MTVFTEKIQRLLKSNKYNTKVEYSKNNIIFSDNFRVFSLFLHVKRSKYDVFFKNKSSEKTWMCVRVSLWFHCYCCQEPNLSRNFFYYYYPNQRLFWDKKAIFYCLICSCTHLVILWLKYAYLYFPTKNVKRLILHGFLPIFSKYMFM